MDREKIERLAIDSISGQLNEDAEALLEEYLAGQSAEKGWFSEMQEIYKETQAALDAKTHSVKEKTENRSRLKFRRFPATRWAAVILICICVGAAAGRWSKSDTQRLKVQTRSSVNSAKVQETSLEDFLTNLGDGFWRDKITAMLNPSVPKIYIERSSVPSLLEQYRQYLKERNHE